MGNNFRHPGRQAVELVWQDLASDKQGKPATAGKSKKQAEAKGMTAKQVLRFAIVKMKEQLAVLAFNLQTLARHLLV
jgi:serine acetyltransferase